MEVPATGMGPPMKSLRTMMSLSTSPSARNTDDPGSSSSAPSLVKPSPPPPSPPTSPCARAHPLPLRLALSPHRLYLPPHLPRRPRRLQQPHLPKHLRSPLQLGLAVRHCGGSHHTLAPSALAQKTSSVFDLARASLSLRGSPASPLGCRFTRIPPARWARLPMYKESGVRDGSGTRSPR